MRLPLVKVRPGGPDGARLRKLGAVPPNAPAPGEGAAGGPDLGGLAAGMEAATAHASMQMEFLRAQIESAPDGAAMKRVAQEGMPEIMRGIKDQIDAVMATVPPPPAPPEAGEGVRQMQASVDANVQAFKQRVAAAQGEFSAASENARSEAAMQEAAQGFKTALADAGGNLLQQYTGYNPVAAYEGGSALYDMASSGKYDAAGGLNALAGIAGAFPGGAELAEGLGMAAKIAPAVQSFASLLGDGPPDLANMAATLDNIQDFALGKLMGELPPEAQMAISAAQSILKAYGIEMPSLSELAGFKEKEPPTPKAPGCYVEGQFIATILNPTTHGSPTLPGPGALMVLYQFMPVWRVGMDFHMCPIVKGVVPDVGGVVVKGAVKTIVMFAPCARKGDIITEIPGGPNPIIPLGASEPIESSSDDSDESDAPSDDSSSDSGDGGGSASRDDSTESPTRDESDAGEGLNESPENPGDPGDHEDGPANQDTPPEETTALTKPPEAPLEKEGGGFGGHGASGSWDGPTDTDNAKKMAQFSDDVYNDKSDPSKLPPGAKRIEDFSSPDSDYQAALYRDSDGKLVLAYRGTSSASDGLTDVGQGLGFKSDQYNHAAADALDVKRRYPGEDVQLTGHSLGGGLATIGSAATGYPATTFNAANVHPNSYDNASSYTGSEVDLKNVPSASKNYQVSGEPLSGLQNNAPAIGAGIGTAIGSSGGFIGGAEGAVIGAGIGEGIHHSPLQQVVLEPKDGNGDRIPYNVENKGRHGITAVHKALDYKSNQEGSEHGASGSW